MLDEVPISMPEPWGEEALLSVILIVKERGLTLVDIRKIGSCRSVSPRSKKENVSALSTARTRSWWHSNDHHVEEDDFFLGGEKEDSGGKSGTEDAEKPKGSPVLHRESVQVLCHPRPVLKL